MMGKIEIVPAWKMLGRMAFGLCIGPVDADVPEFPVQIGDVDRDARKDPLQQLIGPGQFIGPLANLLFEVLVGQPDRVRPAPLLLQFLQRFFQFFCRLPLEASGPAAVLLVRLRRGGPVHSRTERAGFCFGFLFRRDRGKSFFYRHDGPFREN